MDQYIGKLLDNRYEILELIGIGGMARVYKARCHRLNRLVAIKILREDLAQDAEFRRRFHDESQAVAMLSHPNIVAVYDVSRASNFEYIVMELIDGITLKQYMQKKGNQLNWREALHFTTQIIKALGHAHSRGIIHRDIKPHNVMVLRDGSVKVADFGIARVASGRHSTLTQEALGSVHYISPEQAKGSYIDARSDLYSAGVVLYEMITGRLPFEGDTPVSVAIQHINSIPLSPRELDPSIPEALEAITMKAMAPTREKRYADADEMLADLEEFRKNPNINFEYDRDDYAPVEADTDKTQVRSTPVSSHTREPRGEPVRKAKVYELEYDDEDIDPPRSSALQIVLSIIAVLFFVGIIFVFLYKTFFAGILAPAETYAVPNLVGQKYEEILEDTEFLGRFTVVSNATVSSDTVEAGRIIDQQPAANSVVGNAVTQITVTVSSGPEKIVMTDLYNMEYRDAYLEVERLHLRALTPIYEHNDVIAYNHVISFTPLKDTHLSPGDTVQMVVSLGPESLKFPMPSLIQMTKEQAESKLAMLNLEVGTISEEYSETVPAGVVMDQHPGATTEVGEGTKVNLQVSIGPDPASIPAEITKNIDIPLPESDEVINVMVMMDGVVVYEHNEDAAMNSAITIQLTASGTKILSVFYDGVLGETITVEFVE